MREEIFVVNSNGEKERFSFRKVYRSALRAGAPRKLAQQIAENVEKEIYSGISTREIYEKVKDLLKKDSPGSALRINLKEAMRRLGPTGFPFEKFIREILMSYGFEVEINRYLKGACPISYEIDFVAKKDKMIYIGECKYHHEFGARVDLQVALANWARFLDIKNSAQFQQLASQGFEIKSMLVTNTKFTKEAIKYANCKGTELLGWKYPPKRSLENLIEAKKLYPITILPSLKGYLKSVFAENKMMLAKDILREDIETLSKKLNVLPRVIRSLYKEADILIGEKIQDISMK